METKRTDIVIELHLRGDNFVRSKLLLQTFDNLETALFSSDRRDVEMAASELSIPNVARDATLERLRKYKNNRLLLTEARTGSIVLSMAVAGVAIKLLEITIGETVKESYLASDLHRRLSEFFSTQIDVKALNIAENVRRVFASKKHDISVKLLSSSGSEPTKIIVDIQDGNRPEQVERVGSLSEELDKLR